MNDTPKIKCAWFDRCMNPCQKFIIEGTDYCSSHEYVPQLLDEENKETMKNKKIICSGFVKKIPCESKALENGYCSNHQIQKWKIDMEKDGTKKVCDNYLRSCKTILDINDKYKNCETCRKVDRESDKARRMKKIENYSKVDTIQNTDGTVVSTKKCINCNESYSLDKFITTKGIQSNKCNVKCLPEERLREAERDRSNRDYKTYEQKPERKEAKKQWKEDHPEKSAEYSHEYKKKIIQEIGLDGYHEKTNEYVNTYRKNNPEKQKAINEKKKSNVTYKYTNYSREAINKGRKYDLTLDESRQYFLDNCYYCGNVALENVTLNGIDRKNNNLDYTLDNCVTSCEMCNVMKGDKLNDEEFIILAQHILTNLNIVNGILNSECFISSGAIDYEACKSNAPDREIEFELNEIEFFNITEKNCYLCDKPNSDFHMNGIDRVNNSNGYNFDNCRSCCWICNKLKNNYELIDVINKLILIYKKHKCISDVIVISKENYMNIMTPYLLNDALDIGLTKQKRDIVHQNILRLKSLLPEQQNKKLTKEEKKENEIVRKQKQYVKAEIKYGIKKSVDTIDKIIIPDDD